jgi:predicted tellurium resistance membrane protein TerC
VLIDASTPPDAAPAPMRFWQAIWYIVVADLTMSTDNVLAIAGASKGNFWLIAFGLALSIPFVVLSSNLLSKLMDRFPALIYLGAGVALTVRKLPIPGSRWTTANVLPAT